MTTVQKLEFQIHCVKEQISDCEQDRSSCYNPDCLTCQRIEIKLFDLRQTLENLMQKRMTDERSEETYT